MEQLYVLDNAEPEIELEAVLRSINCTHDSPVYANIVKEFNSIYNEAQALIEPLGVLGFGMLTTGSESYPVGSRVIFAVLSVGDKIHQRSNKAFDEGNYVQGILYNAMADCALFSLEKDLQKKLKSVCDEHNIGIAKRLEAPKDIPPEAHKEAWEQLDLKNRFGIDISSGYMFTPLKTSCQVFLITDSTDCFDTLHDCRTCSAVSCQFRNASPVEITVRQGNKSKTLLFKENEALMNALIREGYYIDALCGGKGQCGKCKVQVIEGTASVSDKDKKFFSEKELRAGWRLSCTLYPDMNLTVALEDAVDFTADYVTNETAETGEYNIAIDIGTTTISAQLSGKRHCKPNHIITVLNRQRQYGADVISRIQASADGKDNELKELIRNDLKNIILKLCEECSVMPEQLSKIAISCNTVMGHLLMGYDCTPLGKYPYTPINTGFITGSTEELTGINTNAEVVLLPGISAFVGGDIVSGMYSCDFDRSDDICLLIDLGTNGEMALGNRKKILVTSAAAGPAFESGNIRFGTDVITLTADLLDKKLIDKTGLFCNSYFTNGFPVKQTTDGNNVFFTQKDIRELQLAKAAIRAGAEILIQKYGINKDMVSKVYISGGFGHHLDTDKAIAIGMLPSEFACCTTAIGNSSLAGAIKYLNDSQSSQRLNRLLEISQEISLPTAEDFNEIYMASMMLSVK